MHNGYQNRSLPQEKKTADKCLTGRWQALDQRRDCRDQIAATRFGLSDEWGLRLNLGKLPAQRELLLRLEQ